MASRLLRRLLRGEIDEARSSSFRQRHEVTGVTLHHYAFIDVLVARVIAVVELAPGSCDLYVQDFRHLLLDGEESLPDIARIC